MLFQYWSSVFDAGPTLKPHCVDASCLLTFSFTPVWGLFPQCCVFNLIESRVETSMTGMRLMSSDGWAMVGQQDQHTNQLDEPSP